MISSVKIFRRLAFGLSMLSTSAAIERVIDPFERIEHNIIFEGSVGHSEVFDISPNYYDEEGKKHDDIPGNVLLVLGVSSFAIALAVRPNRERTN